MRYRLVALLLAAAGCASSAAPRSTTAVVDSPGGSSPAISEDAGFALEQGSTTLARERFRRSTSELDVEMTVPGGIRVAYTASLRADASVASIDVRQFAPGAAAGDPPMARSSGTFRGDSVVLSLTRGETTDTARRATVAGVVPYLNPSVALMEQIVRRARAIGGPRVEVPIWLPDGGGRNATAIVETTSSGARLSVGSTEVLLRVDGQGRVLGGEIPAQGIVVERIATPPD